MALRGLPALLLALGACAPVYSGTPNDPFAACRQTLDVGIFNPETLACFPDLDARLEQALCAAGPHSAMELGLLGFGAGFELGGVSFPGMTTIQQMEHGERQRSLAEFRQATRAWAAEACTDSGRLLDDEGREGPQVWSHLHAALPSSLVVPWRACLTYLKSTSETTGIRCYIDAGSDSDISDPRVVLHVDVDPVHWFDRKTRLTQDVQVRGADCAGSLWRRGKRLSNSRDNTLSCRRIAGSPVTFQVVTGKGSCTVERPPSPAASWPDTCRALPD